MNIRRIGLMLAFCVYICGCGNVNASNALFDNKMILGKELSSIGKEKLAEINALEDKYGLHDGLSGRKISEDEASAFRRSLELKSELASFGVIINYSGGSYKYALQEAIGDHKVEAQHVRLLAMLNYWEQNCSVSNEVTETDYVSDDLADSFREAGHQLDRLGVDVRQKGDIYVIHSVKRAELLEELARLDQRYGHRVEDTVNPDTEKAIAIRSIRAKRAELAKLGGIPVWDGEKWMDERRSARGGANIASETAIRLAMLNYLDRNYGALSIPEKVADTFIIAGETFCKVSDIKSELRKNGFMVELDKGLSIWTIRLSNNGAVGSSR